MSIPEIKLWGNKISPFSQRVEIVLKEKQVACDYHEVDFKNKDALFKEKYASVHPNPEAPAKVPTLEDTDGTVLIESMVIVRYLDEKFPESPLMPQDPATKAKVELFIELSPIMAKGFAMIKADTQAGVAEAKAAFVELLKEMNTMLVKLGSNDGGDYFLGGHYSLAEAALSPLVFRLIPTLKATRSVNTWALCEEHKLDRLTAWLHAALSRPSLVETAPEVEVMVGRLSNFAAPLKD